MASVGLSEHDDTPPAPTIATATKRGTPCNTSHPLTPSRFYPPSHFQSGFTICKNPQFINTSGVWGELGAAGAVRSPSPPQIPPARTCWSWAGAPSPFPTLSLLGAQPASSPNVSKILGLGLLH